VPNSVRVLDDPPVDLRGDGGLVIGPGSVHPSGSVYQLQGDLVAASDLPVYRREWFPQAEQAPEKTFRRPVFALETQATRDAVAQARAYMKGVPGAAVGCRDATAYVMACRLVRGFDLGDERAMELLLEWNTRCSPPLDEWEIGEKIKHARAYGNGEYGAMLLRGNNIGGGLLCFGWPAQ